MSGLMRWHNRVAVITGVAKGIGAAIAQDLLKAGIIVAGLDYNETNLKEFHNNLETKLRSRLHTYACNVNDEQQLDMAFDDIEQKLGGVDILINNAGVHYSDKLCNVKMDIVRDVFETNCMQVVHCTQRAYKSMKKRSVNGHIIFMNSISAHTIVPLSVGVRNVYMPSKRALSSLHEVFRQEFREQKLNIKVTNLCPGLVDTDMVPESWRQKNDNRLLTVKDISKAVMGILDTPQHVQVLELVIGSM